MTGHLSRIGAPSHRQELVRRVYGGHSFHRGASRPDVSIPGTQCAARSLLGANGPCLPGAANGLRGRNLQDWHFADTFIGSLTPPWDRGLVGLGQSRCEAVSLVRVHATRMLVDERLEDVVESRMRWSRSCLPLIPARHAAA